jgi:hypothetical protein
MKITARRVTDKPASNVWQVRFQMEHDDTLTETLPSYDEATNLAEEPVRQAGCVITDEYADIDYWLERGDPDKGWGVLVFLFTF